jgi:hypothetical protein
MADPVQYDPKKVNAVLDHSHTIIAWNALSITKREGEGDMVVSTDGYPRMVLNASEIYDADIDITDYSPSNSKFQELLSLKSAFKFGVTDKSSFGIGISGDLFVGSYCFIMTRPVFTKNKEGEVSNLWRIVIGRGKQVQNGAGTLAI